ncbi:NAD-dependent protein deacetylase [Enterococcus sp. DIV0609]|uniref:NAD-dependent protein deacylase n=1 Tax=unclassified Enterococcus TaxID=2608891 RepID=UPI003F22ED01
MQDITQAEAIHWLATQQKITFLTGAGISTASGVPDYRSLKGVYQGIQQPEYLLSRTCLKTEPEKFYQFVKTLYHPDAQPNIIHQKMAQLEQMKRGKIVSQNIDGLHRKAGSQEVVDFHGNLYECYCQTCGTTVPWQDYLLSDRHADCHGQIRPAITLYEEGLSEEAIEKAIQAVASADLIVIVGTSFQVHPFCDLIHYKQPMAAILAINQTPLFLQQPYYFLEAKAETIFAELTIKE